MLLSILPAMLHLPPGRWARSVTKGSTIGLLLAVAACGGGGGGGTGQPFATVSDSGPPTGPATKIVTVANTPGAVVALFPDGRALWSPDGFNLAGGGSTVAAYSGQLQIMDVVPVAGGVDALLSDGSVYYSPDGRNLGGGGNSVRAADPTLRVASLTSVGTGVNAALVDAGPVYHSPDGRNLAGGGASVLAYSGGRNVRQIVPVGPGDAVVTLFAEGDAWYSPDNRNLGGGGATVAAASPGEVTRLVKIGGGVLAELAGGDVRLSPNGRSLEAGVAVADWTRLPDASFAPRDSANGVAFAGHLWVSGGFTDPSLGVDCLSTCSYFDLWASDDLSGTAWNETPAFATATSPNPRDVDPTDENGVVMQAPTDFYDSYSALVVWQGELTAIGATVWRSPDGINWQRNNLADGTTAAPGPLPVRATENTRAVVLGDALFVVQPDSGEVYRSTDAQAKAWTPLGAIPGFAPRCGAVVFTLGGRMWIEGGGACDYSHVYNDIWSSADGLDWTREALPAAWSARMWSCVTTSADGVVWLAAGYAPTDWTGSAQSPVVRYSANRSDVWYSRDAKKWKQFKADVGSALPDDGVLEPRHAPTCFVTGSPASGMHLLVIAGSGSPSPNGAEARVLSSMRSLPLPTTGGLP